MAITVCGSSQLDPVTSLSREFLLHYGCCPVERTGDGAILAAVAPDAAHGALDDIAVAYQSSVTTSDVSVEELERFVERLTDRYDRNIQLEPDTDSSNAEDD